MTTTALEKFLAKRGGKNVESNSMASKLQKEISSGPTIASASKSESPKKRTRKTSSSASKKPIKRTSSIKDTTYKVVPTKDDDDWEEAFVPVTPYVVLRWACPKCKKKNSQDYKKVADCVGPEWCAKKVICNKCNTEFNIGDPEE